jgi:RNA polymerase sigma-70 factor (ECF subfamily)
MEELYHTEKILLERIASGDRKAFNQLHTAHIGNVYNYIYLFTKSKDETEEILQEVFVSIWENREKLEVVRSFKHYLFRAAKNKLINHIRHSRIKNRVLAEIGQHATGIMESPDDQLTYKEYHRLLQEAIEILPPKRKQIFKLNIEDGASFDQIADQLEISKSVVKKQFYQASNFVREYLYKRGGILSILFIYWLALLHADFPFFK